MQGSGLFQASSALPKLGLCAFSMPSFVLENRAILHGPCKAYDLRTRLACVVDCKNRRLTSPEQSTRFHAGLKR